MRLDRIHQVAIKAVDLDASIAFYRDTLGANLIAKFDPPGIAFFDFDGIRVMLDKNASETTVYYRVDDLDAALTDVEATVEITSPPHMIFPDNDGLFGPAGEGEWMAFITDPAGNLVGLAARRPLEA